MIKKLKLLVTRFRNEIGVYQRVLRDPRVPRRARWLLGIAVAYALSPIDLIPDFIPVLGYLDDVVILALLIWLACRSIPEELLLEHRRSVEGDNT